MVEGDQKEKSEKKTIWNFLKFLLIIVAVVSLGLLAVNQALTFFYKAAFLKTPCELCGDLNPEVEECINRLNDPRPSFWIGGDNWTDPFQENKNKIKINYSS